MNKKIPTIISATPKKYTPPQKRVRRRFRSALPIKLWNIITNRFSPNIVWYNFRIDFCSSSKSNSFPSQAFEFSSTWGLFWDQISFFSKINFKMIIFKIIIWKKYIFSKISNSGTHRKNFKKFFEKYFWSTSDKDCDTKSTTWFGLVTALSPETHRPLPSGTDGLGLLCPHFWVGFGGRFKRSFSVWFVFHSKTLFSSRPITDSTNTLDFTSV